MRHAPSNGSGRVQQAGVTTTLAILSCPPALCPHAEFAIAAVVATPIRVAWSVQPARPETLCASVECRVEPGTAGRLAARLRTMDPICFDAVEGPQPVGERYSYTPALGMFRADLAPNGDVTVSEQRLRDLLSRAEGAALTAGLNRLLGLAWDAELEPLRRAAEGVAVTTLRQTG